MFATSLSRPDEPWRGLMLHSCILALYRCSTGGTNGAGWGGAEQQMTAFRTQRAMIHASKQTEAVQGIEGVLLAQRGRIIRFLELRGAGDEAEDLFQELWMRLTKRPIGPVGDPVPYIMRAANNLMLDRYRSVRQRLLRDHDWSETQAEQMPSAELTLIARERLALVEQAIDETGERSARIFRRFRVDGVTQRDIAAEAGISVSTVEADLRKVYAALVAIGKQFDAS